MYNIVELYTLQSTCSIVASLSVVQRSTIQYSTVLYITEHYYTIQYRNILHSTVMYNTAQYNTIQPTCSRVASLSEKSRLLPRTICQEGKLLNITNYWTLQSTEHHKVLNITMYWTSQCTQHHNILNTTMYLTSQCTALFISNCILHCLNSTKHQNVLHTLL